MPIASSPSLVFGAPLARRRLATMLIAAGLVPGRVRATAPSATTSSLSIAVGQERRTAWLHVPASLDPTIRHPLVFGFHGGAGAAHGYIDNARLFAKAGAAGFIAVCPEGTPLALPGDHRIWNSGPEYARASRDADDVRLTRLLIDRVAELHAIDTRRVFATGFSNGGQMAYRLALELAGAIAAIAPMSGGRLAGAPRPARPVPVLHFHGTADGFYPLEGGLGAHSIGRVEHAPIAAVIDEWTAFDGAHRQAWTVSHEGWSVQAHDGPAPVALVLVNGMGHQIAGGGDDLLPDQAMRNAPDAVGMALKFFTDLSLG